MHLDNVRVWAHEQAKSLIPHKDVPETHEADVDWVRIECGQVTGSIPNDNCRARAHYFHTYLREHVLKDWSNGLSVDGYYRVTYHDAYTDTSDLMVYAKNKDFKHQSLIPDYYQTGGYSWQLKPIADYTPVHEKKPEVCFYGASTGNCAVAENDRINACLWSIDHRHCSKFYITNLCQIDSKTLDDCVGVKAKAILTNPISIQEQLKSRFVMSIDGNTAAWDRPVWIMQSKCPLFKYESPNVLWYYPAMKADVHYIDVPNLESIPNLVHEYLNQQQRCADIVERANIFVQEYCCRSSHVNYMRELLCAAKEINGA